MFYVKTKINDEIEINTPITDENTFTYCPECGLEHAVDLSEIFRDGNTDLYGTAVYCSECSAERQKENA